MVGRIQKDLKVIGLAQVKEILEKRAEEGEIGYEQQLALDYAKKFAKLTKEQTQELVDQLMQIEQMNLETAYKIADILPKFKETLLVILSKDRISLNDNEIDRIMNLIKEARDKIGKEDKNKKEEIKSQEKEEKETKKEKGKTKKEEKEEEKKEE
jgi:DNA-directed RNA polymerase subunit F